MSYFVYIISNSENTPLYVGMTNNLEKRVYEHKNKLLPEAFSSKYNLNKLLYWESGEDVNSVIAREKQLKNWHKSWKLNLIKTTNPLFKDLSSLPNFLDPETSSG
jgi:putative endonuclease